jgi:hypothetical protein
VAKGKAVVKGLEKLGELLGGTTAERMARAAEQGFDTPVFHYSRRGDDITEFGQSKWDLSPFSIGPHVGSKQAALDRFAQTGGEARARNISTLPGSTEWAREMRATTDATYPLMAKTGSQFTDAGKPWRESDLSQHLRDLQVNKFGEDFHDYTAANKWLADDIWSKYDSIPYVNDVEDPGNISYIMNPKSVRSINADFNPANKDSPNLLASLAIPVAAGLAGTAALAPQDAEAGGITKGGKRPI